MAIVDGASVVTGFAVSFLPPGRQYFGVPLGTAGLVLGGPIVHWAHGNVGKGFASFGIRGAGTGIGFGVGVAIALATQTSHDDFRGLNGGIVGLPIGAALGAVIDIAVLAYGKPPAGRAASARFVAPFPVVDVRPGQTVLGLGAAF